MAYYVLALCFTVCMTTDQAGGWVGDGGKGKRTYIYTPCLLSAGQPSRCHDNNTSTPSTSSHTQNTNGTMFALIATTLLFLQFASGEQIPRRSLPVLARSDTVPQNSPHLAYVATPREIFGSGLEKRQSSCPSNMITCSSGCCASGTVCFGLDGCCPIGTYPPPLPVYRQLADLP